MGFDGFVLDHSDWDSNLAMKTDLASTCRIEVKLVTNCDEWFPLLVNSISVFETKV